MTDEPTGEPEPEQDPPAPNYNDPEVSERIFQRLTKRGAAALLGGELIARKIRSFTLDGQCCAPDFFIDPSTGEYFDVRVTLRSLTSTEEIQALNGVTDAGQVPYMLTRAALYAINGKPIPEARKDFFWEGFGMQGRQLCLMAFQHIGSASGAAVGKFQSSISVG